MKNFLYFFLLLSTFTSYATEYTWIGGDSNWNEATNWNPTGIPGTGDTILLTNVFSSRIEIDTSITVNRMVLDGNCALWGTDTLTIDSSMIWKKGSIQSNTIVDGVLTIDGVGTGSGIFGSHLILNDTTYFEDGRLIVAQTGGQVINNGIFYLRSDIHNTSPLCNCYPLSLEVSASSFTERFINRGIFMVEMDGEIIKPGFASFKNEKGAVFSKELGGELDTYMDSFTNEGTITGMDSIYFGFYDYAVSAFQQDGIIAPGKDSVGTLMISQNKILDLVGGKIEIEIYDSTGAGTGNDLLIIENDVVLGGILEITLPTGFVPAIGNSFAVVNLPNGYSGTFGAVNVPLLNNAAWEITYNLDYVVLSVITPPEEYAYFEVEVEEYHYENLINGCDDDCITSNLDDPKISLQLHAYNSNNLLIGQRTLATDWDDQCSNFFPPFVQFLSGFFENENWRIEVSLDGKELDGFGCGDDDGVCGGFEVIDTILPQDFYSAICQDTVLFFSRVCDGREYGVYLNFTSWFNFVKAGEVGMTKSTFSGRSDLTNNLNLETTTPQTATPNSTYEWEVLKFGTWENTGITEENAKLVTYLLDSTAALGAYTFRRRAINDQIDNCTKILSDYSNHITLFVTDECNQVTLEDDFESGTIASPTFTVGGVGANLWSPTPNGANYSNYRIEAGDTSAPSSLIISYIETSVDITDMTKQAKLKFDMTYNMKGRCSLIINNTVVEVFSGINDKWNIYTYDLPIGQYIIRWEYQKEENDLFNPEESVQLDNILIYESHPDLSPLLSLYYDTDGDVFWTNKSGWENRIGFGQNCDPCTWYGVSCDSMERVIAVKLPNNNIIGQLPSDIQELTKLDTLLLADNSIDKTLGEWITYLPELRVLNLSNNNIIGKIENWVENFPKIKQLDLSNNAINGALVDELGNVSTLTYLKLNNNSISECLPPALSNLDSLELLNLQNNLLGGYFPDDYDVFCPVNNPTIMVDFSGNTNLPNGGDFTMFCNIDAGASNNNFERNILEQLYQELGGDNWFINTDWLMDCNVCDWFGITCNSNNEVIRITLSDNNLIGAIPDTIGSLPKLEILNLSDNHLTGFLPLGLVNLSNSILLLDLQDNNLKGCYPSQYSVLCASLELMGNDSLYNNGDITEFCAVGRGTCCTDDPSDLPPNDSCSTAINIPLNNSAIAYNWNATTAISPTGGFNCDTPEAEVWYTFKTSCEDTSQVSIGVNNSEWTYTNIELFSNNCGTLLSIACDTIHMDSLPNVVLSFDSLNTLDSNTVYYLRVWGSGTEARGKAGVYVNQNSGINCTEDCPSTLNFTSDPLMNETFEASDTIISVVEIASGLSIIYKAGKTIVLKPPISGVGVGFHAANGSDFHAFIEDCSVNINEVIESRTQEIVEEESSIKIYPNPFSTSTTIEYELFEISEVQLQVLDMTGRVVETLLRNQWQVQGRHQIEWIPQQKQAGIYFLRVRIGEKWKTQKMILVE